MTPNDQSDPEFIKLENQWENPVYLTGLSLICFLFPVASKLSQLNNLRDENEELKCQIEVYKNELAVLKQENKNSSSDKDKEVRSLQLAMQGMQQVGSLPVGHARTRY